MLQVGDTVFHHEMGEGEIIYIYNQESLNPKISVKFKNGQKAVLLKDTVTLKTLPEEIEKETNDSSVQNKSDNSAVTSKSNIFNETEFLDKIKKMFKQVISDNFQMEQIELGDKWVNGKIILVPGTEGLKNKEIPIETFFHKIVMVRDRLRVLEQNINSNKKLSDEDKVNLQQYITKTYGSLTTFNILFKDKDDYFVGQKS